jgi:type I restriction enzyme S subunit
MKRGAFETVPLGELLEEAPRNGYSPVCPESPTGKWVLGLSALDGRGLDLSEPKPAPVNDPLVDKFMLRPGDFLIGRSNTFDKVGRVGVFRGGLENCSYPDLMMRFRPDCNKVNPLYLEAYLKSDAAIRFIRQHATGTSGSMKKINQSTVESIPVVVPSLPEQALIATLLLEWYDAIQKTEQLIAVKERYYTHELSRLLSEDRTTLRTCRLGDISYVPQKFPETPKADDVYVLVKLYCKGIERNERQKKASTKNGRPIFRRNAGELLVGRQNIHNGGFGILPKDLDGALASNAITSLSFHPEKASAEYVFFYLSRPSYYKKLERLMGGTGQKEISESQLMALSIPLPALHTQIAIARYLNALREEIALLGQSLDALKQQKRGLMQKLLTGQWRVPLPDAESNIQETAPC